MTDVDAVELLAEQLRRKKLEVVRAHGDDPDDEACDLPPVALAVRDGEQVSQLWGTGGQEAARTVVFYASALFGAQDTYLVADGRLRVYSKDTVPPDLPMGELSRQWKEGQREDIKECLIVHRFGPQGVTGMSIFPYRRVGRLLIWEEAQRDLAGATNIGAVPQHAIQGFAKGAALEAATAKTLAEAAEAMGLTPEQRRYHRDRASGRLVSTYPFVGMVTVFSGGLVATFIDGEEL